MRRLDLKSTIQKLSITLSKFVKLKISSKVYHILVKPSFVLAEIYFYNTVMLNVIHGLLDLFIFVCVY